MHFLLNSTNQYGVHSPFVYDFMTKGLRKKIPEADRNALHRFRKSLENDKTVIQVKDFGAGSRVFKGPGRPVNRIASNAGISKSRSEKLYKTVKHFNPKTVLELGTSVGLATASLSLAAPKASIDTLEGCPATAEIARSRFERYSMSNVSLHVGEFNTTLPELLQKKSSKKEAYDLVFFDGNHQKDPTLRYFELCLSAIHENSVFIFDDIHWSPEMEMAWAEIQKHPRVSLTIDSFQWGMVFFQEGREKEHFVLRL